MSARPRRRSRLHRKQRGQLNPPSESSAATGIDKPTTTNGRTKEEFRAHPNCSSRSWPSSDVAVARSISLRTDVRGRSISLRTDLWAQGARNSWRVGEGGCWREKGHGGLWMNVRRRRVHACLVRPPHVPGTGLPYAAPLPFRVHVPGGMPNWWRGSR